MHPLSELYCGNSEPGALNGFHDQQLLRELAEAADAANAHYLALRSVAGSQPADIESMKRRWLVLERLRHKLAAREMVVRPDRSTVSA